MQVVSKWEAEEAYQAGKVWIVMSFIFFAVVVLVGSLAAQYREPGLFVGTFGAIAMATFARLRAATNRATVTAFNDSTRRVSK